MRTLSTLLKVLAVFLLLGPPIGALTIFAIFGLLAAVQTGDVAGLAWIFLFGLVYGVPLSYLAGTVPAAIAGVSIAARALWFETRPGLVYATTTGALVGLGLNHLGGQSIASAMQNPVSEATAFVTLLAACLVATLGCWAVVRRRLP